MHVKWVLHAVLFVCLLLRLDTFKYLSFPVFYDSLYCDCSMMLLTLLL